MCRRIRQAKQSICSLYCIHCPGNALTLLVGHGLQVDKWLQKQLVGSSGPGSFVLRDGSDQVSYDQQVVSRSKLCCVAQKA